MKRHVLWLAVLGLALSVTVALAFNFGTGHISTSRSDNTTSIHYWITGGDGTGTPALTCEVTSPSGRTTYMSATGSAWDDAGESHAYFHFSGPEAGVHRVVCYWEIKGYGDLDGRRAVASTTFNR